MRVDENVRKSVLFIGKCNKDGRFTPVGTAFLMVVTHLGGDFDFVVTARHNLEVFGPSEKVYLRVNNIGGTTTTLPTQLTDWQLHPARKNYVDVAVIPTSFIDTSSSDKFDGLNDPGCG